MSDPYRVFAGLVLSKTYTEEELANVLKAFMGGSANHAKKVNELVDEALTLVEPLKEASPSVIQASVLLIKEDIDTLDGILKTLRRLMPEVEVPNVVH